MTPTEKLSLAMQAIEAAKELVESIDWYIICHTTETPIEAGGLVDKGKEANRSEHRKAIEFHRTKFARLRKKLEAAK